MIDGSEREMTLDEWCERLHKDHRVNKQLLELKARAKVTVPDECPTGLAPLDTLEDALKRADSLATPTQHSGQLCSNKDLRRIVLLAYEYRKANTTDQTVREANLQKELDDLKIYINPIVDALEKHTEQLKLKNTKYDSLLAINTRLREGIKILGALVRGEDDQPWDEAVQWLENFNADTPLTAGQVLTKALASEETMLEVGRKASERQNAIMDSNTDECRKCKGTGWNHGVQCNPSKLHPCGWKTEKCDCEAGKK